MSEQQTHCRCGEPLDKEAGEHVMCWSCAEDDDLVFQAYEELGESEEPKESEEPEESDASVD